MTTTTPWAQGQVPRLRLHARQNSQNARARVPRTETPTPRVALNGERVLDEGQINELLFSEEAADRRLALNTINDRLQLVGDLLTGGRTVQLSSTDLFPDGRHAGIPEALSLSDTNRQRVDLRWLALFSTQDRRPDAWPGYFKVSDLYHAVTVDQYLPGERIKFGHVEKGEEIFEHLLYGTGIQWNQLEMQQRWERQEGVTAMQIKWLNKLAALAYAALTASGLATIAYDTTGSNQLEKDIRTVNKAALEIHKGLFEATPADEQGTGDQPIEEEISEDTPLYLLYNSHTERYEDRISDALETRFTRAQGGGLTISEVKRPIIPLGSPRVPTGNWFMFLAGRKNIYSQHRDLRFYDFMDPRIAGVGEGEVGWGAYRLLRGDANQGRKLGLS